MNSTYSETESISTGPTLGYLEPQGKGWRGAPVWLAMTLGQPSFDVAGRRFDSPGFALFEAAGIQGRFGEPLHGARIIILVSP